MVPCKSTAEEVSFEWSHHRILSTDSKLELHYMFLHCLIDSCLNERGNNIDIIIIPMFDVIFGVEFGHRNESQ